VRGIAAPVTFIVGDALKEVSPGPYDVITCAATIHHMLFSDALTCFRQHLAVAIPANVAMAWIKNKGRKAPRPASMTTPARPATMTFADIVRATHQALPGTRLHRRLFWRYTLVWHRPWQVDRPTVAAIAVHGHRVCPGVEAKMVSPRHHKSPWGIRSLYPKHAPARRVEADEAHWICIRRRSWPGVRSSAAVQPRRWLTSPER
jgi:hypothetical protein